MSLRLESSEVQQNLGETVDRVMLEGDVVVERYGTPRVAMVEYGRYRRLLEAKKELLRVRLRQGSEAAAARAARLDEDQIDELIERARAETNEETSAA